MSMNNQSFQSLQNRNKILVLTFILSAMSQGYDKEAARKRRGEKRRLKRRSAAIKQANA